MTSKVCIVAGTGPGTGIACARRFAAGGYRVAMLARTKERLAAWEAEIPNSKGYAVDVREPDSIGAAVAEIRTDLGAPSVLIYNAVAAHFAEFDKIDPAKLENAFKVNTMGLLHLARAVTPAMVEAGHGAIIVTGNTAARRGKPAFAGFAPTKAAQRILAESMARTLGPKGVHVAYLIIDAVIDVPWARERYADRPDDFFAKPDGIAAAAWDLAHQDRSAWAFDMEIRPFGETW